MSHRMFSPPLAGLLPWLLERLRAKPCQTAIGKMACGKKPAKAPQNPVTQFLPTREAKKSGLFRLLLHTFHPCPQLALLPDATRRRPPPRRPRAPLRAASISLHRSAGLELSSSFAPLPAPPGLEGVGPVGDRGRGGAEEEEARDDGVEAGRKEAAEVRGPLPHCRGAQRWTTVLVPAGEGRWTEKGRRPAERNRPRRKRSRAAAKLRSYARERERERGGREWVTG